MMLLPGAAGDWGDGGTGGLRLGLQLTTPRHPATTESPKTAQLWAIKR